MSFYFVTTTVASREQALGLESIILEGRLAACVQRIDIESAYWWKGRIEREPEILLLVKTCGDMVESLISVIQENHTYETPEIVAFPIASGLPDYLKWIDSICRRGGEDDER